MMYILSRSSVLKLWQQLGNNSFGRWLVSKIVCFKTPYFSSIRPLFTVLQPGKVEVIFNNRRAVQNYIKSVYAIFMCNAAELAGGDWGVSLFVLDT